MTLATGGTTVPTTADAKADATPTRRCDTRKKMLVSAAQVMRERGAAGVTIDEVLARSGAPRGSVYYHFPEGRNQILTEALRYSGESMTALIDDAAGWGARALLREFVDFWERLLVEGDFAAGCPVVAAAIGSDDADAASLAVTSIAALEGSIVLARSTRSIDPLHQVGDQLEFLIKAREFVIRNKIGQ